MWLKCEWYPREAVCGLALASTLLLCPTLAGAQASSNPDRASMPATPPQNLPVQPPAHGQETFPTAELAVRALVSAVQDDDAAVLDRVLGSDAEKILSSGDAAEDQQDRVQFLGKYAQMHRMVTEADGLTTL